LYLSSSPAGVRAEVAARRICIQEYCFRGARIVDLTRDDVSNLICSAFDLAESAGVDGRDGPNTYAFSQFLASILAFRRVDGFLVPGVRGTANHAYSNLVVFRPRARWRSWSRRDGGFVRDA